MAITVKSDFWGNAYSFIRPKSSLRKVVARLLNQKEMRSDRALISMLIGQTAGETAEATLARVQHSETELGGVRVIEQEVLIDRPTTEADEADLNVNLLSYDSQQDAYPVDKATRP